MIQTQSCLQSRYPLSKTQSLHLRILDKNFKFESHSPELYHVFEQMYRRFTFPHPLETLDQESEIIVRQQRQSNSGNTDEQVSIFDVSRLLQAYVTQVRSHLLFHAGVLSFADQGILLVAPSMHGKTTLTLKLVCDGFQFLSDDIAPIGLEDSFVHPFPRSFVIRPGSLTMAGFPPLPPETPMWLGKQIVDADTLQSGCMGKAVPLRHIFFLHDAHLHGDGCADQTHSTLPKPNEGVEPFELLLNDLPAGLESALQTISGIHQITIAKFNEQVRLEILAQNRIQATQEVDLLCKAHKVDLIHLDSRAWHRPTFNGPAQLTKLSHSKAVLQLLDQFLGGYHSELFQNEMGNSPIRLSMTLARMIQNANCYRLRVGPLDEMAELVKDAVDVNR